MSQFTYDWSLSDLKDIPKNDLKVFSCFSGGGGSSMGYKMSGCNVIGFCEIDKKMSRNYLLNLKTRLPYIMPIQDISKNDSIIKQIGEIDILDGSPPCSSFTMIGNRLKDWGKKRVFKEGNYHQVLDTLFFNFIDFAKMINPKVIIAENVKGILLGKAKEYTNEIMKRLRALGYITQVFLLNGNKMGLPQNRERVFFIANKKKKIDLTFNERPIPVKDIKVKSFIGNSVNKLSVKRWKRCCVGRGFSASTIRGKNFNYIKVNPLSSLPTIIAKSCLYHWEKPVRISEEVLIKASSFPNDYKFYRCKPVYILGMSVPPLMMHKISERVIEQLF